MSRYDNQERRRSSARERKMARQRRRGAMLRPLVESRDPRVEKLRAIGGQVALWLRDGWWYVIHTPLVLVGFLGLVLLLALVYLGGYVISGDIYPNTTALRVNLGGQSAAEAETLLRTYWDNSVEIILHVDGEGITTVDPGVLGLSFDASATAQAADDAGLGAIFFGEEVAPVVQFEYTTAQAFLLDLAAEVEYVPGNAGYELRDGEVIGVPGHEGRMLNISATLERIQANPVSVVEARRFELSTSPLLPEVSDPERFIEDVQMFASQPIELTGYDPFRNEYLTWPVAPETFISWLEAGQNTLTLREETFRPYVDGLVGTLNQRDGERRYLAPDETMDIMREAIAAGQTSINLRVRYDDITHTVVRGDTVSAIARQYGIPQYLITQANPGLNPDVISINDEIRIPTRDLTLEYNPVPNKRIVVNLETQYLVAFENGRVKFEWPISSGVSNAPTSPGIFQVLSREEVTWGSSNQLCDDAGLVCGRWEMYWFMGIYEVIPGLVNGFHGAVLLPNGNYLGGGSVGFPATFGCVMSQDDQAQLLYEWAEIGTVVEIISDEFAPMSDLGRLVWEGNVVVQAVRN